MVSFGAEGSPQLPLAANDTIHHCVAPADTLAVKEEKTKQKKNFFKKIIDSFNDFDHNYIEPNHYNYALMMQNGNFFQSYRLTSRHQHSNTKQSIRLSPGPSFKVGPYFGWRWIFLGYMFDIGRPKEAAKTTQFNLSLYSSMVGVDFLYLRNTGKYFIKSIDGFPNVETKDVKDMSFNGMNSYTFALNAYYVFNHRHFSYPAAHSQSTVQRRSCGSWMLGFTYDHQRVAYDGQMLPAQIDQGTIDPALQQAKIKYDNYSISFGYAYNWAFARNCLFSISVMPALGYKKQANKKTSIPDDIWENAKNLNFNVITRAAVVWNNTKWFAGVSFVNHTYDFKNDDLQIDNFVTFLNVYAGFNFKRRKR